MLFSSIYPPGVYFQEVEDTPRPAGRSGLASTDGGASTALIHVADDGEGIPPDQLGHIFERFYRGCRLQSGQRRGRY